MEKGFQTSVATDDLAEDFSELSQFCQNLKFIDSVFRPERKSKLHLNHSHVNPRSLEHSFRFKKIVTGMLEKEIPLSNDGLFFRDFLNEYGLEARFNPQGYFEDGDIIEVYDETMSQIFRNETFYRFCSYGLDELIIHPFNYLYRRDPEVDGFLIKRITECFESMENIEFMDSEPHLMQEHFAGNATIFQIQHKWIAPLYSRTTGKKLAFLATQRADRVGQSNVRGIGFVV